MTLPQPLGHALLDFIDRYIAKPGAAAAAAAVTLDDARPAAEEQGRLDRIVKRGLSLFYSGVMCASLACSP
jgi:hypothetical protein